MTVHSIADVRYLQEIGYTDDILSAEPSRVRSILSAPAQPIVGGVSGRRGGPAAATAASSIHVVPVVNGSAGAPEDSGAGGTDGEISGPTDSGAR